MGYNSCSMDGCDFLSVAKLINLPDDHVIALFVAIGKGTTEAAPRADPLAIEDIVINNTF